MAPQSKIPLLLALLGSLLFSGIVHASPSLLQISPDLAETQQRPDLFEQIDSLASDSADRSAALTAATPASINMTSGNFTLSGAPGGTVVLNLKNFVLSGSATFTLEGTATTQFVINVGKRFSLSDHSAIVLGSGVELTNVLFNIKGKGTAYLQGDSVFRGILNAPSRTVRLRNHALAYARVTARKIIVSGSARIIPPPVVSP